MLCRRLVLVVALAAVIAGCANSGAGASAAASASRDATGGSSQGAPATATAAATSQPAPSGTAASDQTDTEWGRIWDALPADFPRFAGSAPAEESATGPASATLAVPGDVAQEAASWMTGQLKDRGYSVDGASAALEDGSFVLDARRDPGCRVSVSIAPTGGVTTITVLYGAACPKP